MKGEVRQGAASVSVEAKELPKGAWGVETSIDLHGCNPKAIRDAEGIKRFVVELCDLIKMKRFGECTVVHFGQDEKVAGFSMTQLIETSLISGHFANATNAAYINVFSCAYYDPEKVLAFTKKWFGAKEATKSVLSRV
jgi:S-adenosylmethionine/arginine decarboxylase-like enzyme